MLKERRELMEREIRKLKQECGKLFFNYIQNLDYLDAESREEYKSKVKRISEMKTELEIVIQLIEDGHE